MIRSDQKDGATTLREIAESLNARGGPDRAWWQVVRATSVKNALDRLEYPHIVACPRRRKFDRHLAL
jgi:hypothetical protein